MDSLLIGVLGIVFLFFLLATGIHIGVALIASGLVGLSVLTGFSVAIKMIVSAFYHKISTPALITLPLFILMGHLASGGGISNDIYNSLNKWLGRFRSGLGVSTIIACTAFGTVCGSSLVTAAVFAKISAPQMRQHNYDKKLAYGICASGGSIGMLIPPSILAIVYGTLSGVSIGKVLMAGVAPGILLMFAFSGTILLIAKLKPSAVGRPMPDVTWKERIKSLKGFWSIVIVGIVIFGGMYAGVFSPSEAAAFAAFILLVIYLFVTLPRLSRRESLKELLKALTETSVTSAMIFLVMGGATVFSQFIVLSGITTSLSALFLGTGLPAFAIMAIFTLVVLILGCFLDGISILCITIPVFNPIAGAAGIDAIWYATVIILSIEVGLITPPLGLNLYAAKGVAEPDVTLEDVFRGCFPFFIAMIVTLAVLYVFPPISTFLPGLVD
jgi:tripartite ATP-independent transporter DctM subunit